MAETPSRPGLAELIDLETGLLHLDGHRAAAVAAGRAALERSGMDAMQARVRAESDAAWRWELAVAWLQRLRASGTPLPGPACARSLRTAGRLLQLIGILLGVVAAKATLSYDGSAPVNLWNFLGIFVLLQIVLFALLLFSLGAGAARGRALLSATQRGLGALARANTTRKLLGFAPDTWQQSWGELARHRDALATRRPLYGEAERWLLFQNAQAVGVGFHLAAAVVFVWLAFFSDLAFAWSTTPAGVDAAWLHGLVEFLALPWAWWSADAVPSLEAVTATQWNRLDRSFVSGDAEASAQASAAWWSFLLCAQLTWGLLPRLLAWFYGGWRCRRALAAAPLDHAGFHQLFDRMLAIEAPGDWQGPPPDEVQGDLLRTATPAPAALPTPSQAIPGLVWGGFPYQQAELTSKLQQRLAWSVAAIHEAGGADAAATEAALQSLARSSDARGLVIFVEILASPNKALLRALQHLRGGLGAQTPILVALVGTQDDEALALWRDYLSRNQDPYLRVEAIG